MKLKIVKIAETSEKIRDRIDTFILGHNTNGEFVNSLKYLSYHPQERFEDDSIAVIDMGNQEVKGVLMAACLPGDNSKHIISHPGTTFAGPVLSFKMDIKSAEEVISLMMSYYEQKYDCVEIRLRPSVYDTQPMDWVQYWLLRREYQYGMMALANVINLQEIENEEQVLTFFSAGRRNHIKKAIKGENYILKKTEIPEERIWRNLNTNLKEKFNSETTHSYEEIQTLCHYFPQNILSFFAERKDGKYGSFVLGYRYKNVFHTQYLDLNYQFSAEYPHLFLIYELIRKAKSEKIAYFSFGASTEARGTILNEGLFQYKNGYGGGAVLLPVMIWDKGVVR